MILKTKTRGQSHDLLARFQKSSMDIKASLIIKNTPFLISVCILTVMTDITFLSSGLPLKSLLLGSPQQYLSLVSFVEPLCPILKWKAGEAGTMLYAPLCLPRKRFNGPA